jgi:hypothetical protein
MMLALSNIFPKHRFFFLSFHILYLPYDVQHKNNLQKGLAEKKEENINCVLVEVG